MMSMSRHQASPQKSRCGRAFNADSANVAFVDDAHIVPKDRFFLTMLPEKWEDVVAALSVQQLMDFAM